MTDEKAEEIKKEPNWPKFVANVTDEVLVLGHQIKYNLYLLSKAIVFQSVLSSCEDIKQAVSVTHQILGVFHGQDNPEKEETKSEKQE
jgi:hypothetical protein